LVKMRLKEISHKVTEMFERVIAGCLMGYYRLWLEEALAKRLEELFWRR